MSQIMLEARVLAGSPEMLPQEVPEQERELLRK